MKYRKLRIGKDRCQYGLASL